MALGARHLPARSTHPPGPRPRPAGVTAEAAPSPAGSFWGWSCVGTRGLAALRPLGKFPLRRLWWAWSPPDTLPPASTRAPVACGNFAWSWEDASGGVGEPRDSTPGLKRRHGVRGKKSRKAGAGVSPSAQLPSGGRGGPDGSGGRGGTWPAWSGWGGPRNSPWGGSWHRGSAGGSPDLGTPASSRGQVSC